MKLTIYKCDNCSKILSDDKTSIDHLSINFGESGLAYKHDGEWVLHRIPSGIKQFCNTDCMGNWVGRNFTEVVDEAN